LTKDNQEKTRQVSLFGGFVEEQTESKPLEFVTIREEVPQDGDHFMMDMDNATYNEEKDCVTIIDFDKSQALTVYFTNYDPKWTTVPDGVRLYNAAERAISDGIPSHTAFEDVVKQGNFTLCVEHMGEKGRLWSVTTTEDN
tara:strand:+ start:12566 stop:12988 length:423 start_codon:yes stop_codon:yes gene_type:complete